MRHNKYLHKGKSITFTEISYLGKSYEPTKMNIYIYIYRYLNMHLSNSRVDRHLERERERERERGYGLVSEHNLKVKIL